MITNKQLEREGFYQRVYQLVRQVPAGHVVTYGQIAATLGNPRQARTVGWAMRACPPDVPWHRVVNAAGRLSTRQACEGCGPQRALLEEEGITFEGNGHIDLDRHGWRCRAG